MAGRRNREGVEFYVRPYSSRRRPTKRRSTRAVPTQSNLYVVHTNGSAAPGPVNGECRKANRFRTSKCPTVMLNASNHVGHGR